MSKTVKYKLVDKVGFLSNYPVNRTILEENGTIVFTGVLVGYGQLSLPNGRFISRTELAEFFQKVEEEVNEVKETTPNYWDGESELEVGMVVDSEYTSQSIIRCIEKEEVVLYVGDVGLCMTTVDDIVKCKDQDSKSKAFKKFLSEWQGHDMMTYAFDTKDSKAPVEDVFNFTYDFLLNEGLLNE